MSKEASVGLRGLDTHSQPVQVHKIDVLVDFGKYEIELRDTL